MSHDRGCWKCGADTGGDKRECFNRLGDRCVKAFMFVPRTACEPVIPTPPAKPKNALKFWRE